jgi:hypothetical protein
MLRSIRAARTPRPTTKSTIVPAENPGTTTIIQPPTLRAAAIVWAAQPPPI